MTSPLATTWGVLSHKVLSSILVDHGSVFPIKDILQSNLRWFPPKDRPIWAAILECLETDTLPTVEAITVRTNGGIVPGYIHQIANLWNDEDNQRVIYHARELKNLGMLADVRSIGDELKAFESIDTDRLTEVINQTQVRLTGIMAEQTERDPSARSVSRQVWTDLENLGLNVIPTGIDWFDEISGGLWPGYNYWIIAPYKSGKTTVMRNICLNAARLGYPTGVFAAEGSRQDFCLGCQAMLATELLLNQERYVDQRQLRLSTLFIKRAWIIWKKEGRAILTGQEQEALTEARRIWEEELPIFVWDSRDHIKDLGTLHHKVKKFKLDYGAEVFWLDYSQLFGKGEKIYDRQSETARTIQDIATTEGVALCVIAQQNEEAVKGRSGNYSSGTKGGGDADAAADFLFIPSLDRDVMDDPSSPNELEIELRHSRWTASGGKRKHKINPSSGLIIDKWLRSETIEF